MMKLPLSDTIGPAFIVAMRSFGAVDPSVVRL